MGPNFLEMSFNTAGGATLLSHNSAARVLCDCEAWRGFPDAPKSVPFEA